MGPEGRRPDLAEVVCASGQDVIKDQDDEDLEVFGGQDVEGGVGLGEVLGLVKDGA